MHSRPNCVLTLRRLICDMWNPLERRTNPLIEKPHPIKGEARVIVGNRQGGLGCRHHAFFFSQGTHALLKLFKCTHFDLANTLTAHFVLCAQVFQRDRFVT